jgi:hypothetical protein
MTTEPAPPAPAPRVAWEAVFAKGWRAVAWTVLAALAVAVFVWELEHRNLLADYVLRPEDAVLRRAQRAVRAELTRYAIAAAVVGAAAGAYVVWRVRRGRPAPSLEALPFVVSLVALPVLASPTFEYEHPYLTGGIVVAVSAAGARAAARYCERRRLAFGDLTRGQAWACVVAVWAAFALNMGFLGYWRYVTFHAEPYDLSWETNAVWGIVHHGVPSISVAADWLYPTQHLPAAYFNNHAPFIYYLCYAPFYALHQRASTLIWLQAFYMGGGVVGTYLVARGWMRRRWLGVAFAVVYALNPYVQAFCLHDVHANVLAIPCLLLAAGLMEAGRARWALAFAALTALCREEAPMYSACLGLFWLCSSRAPRRIRAGVGVVLGSGALLVLVTQWLMPRYGGKPRWDTFSFFFDHVGMGGAARAFLFNPLGAVVAAFEPRRAEFFWLSFLTFGFLALAGWRAGWFLLVALALLVGGSNSSFFYTMNYSAPVVPAVVLMSLMGARVVIARATGPFGPGRAARRAGVAAYVLGVGALCGYLYGNIFSKTYKLTYGVTPFRRSTEYHYANHLGYVRELPPYGERERQLWAAVGRVPPRVPVATSWWLNPQLASRDVAVIYPNLAQGNPPDNRPQYVILDKLPPLVVATEPHIQQLRADPRWAVDYENDYAVVFKRR